MKIYLFLTKSIKKSQFYLLFAVIFSFSLLSYFLFVNSPSNNEKEKIRLMNTYFINEISYLTSLNCSYGLNTLENFINFTGIDVKIIQYWDSCNNKIVEILPFKEKMMEKDNRMCLEDKCFELIREKRNICLIYSIDSFVFFQCI